jgi:hypothetical protein
MYSESPANQGESDILLKPFNIVLKTSGNQFSSLAFANAAELKDISPTPETELLLNLIFDEYHLAGKRTEVASGISDLKRLVEMERQELRLRLDQLIRTRGSEEGVKALLYKNRAHYELYGIDRFSQLYEKTLNHQLFINFASHPDPTVVEDLALSYLLLGKTEDALRVIGPQPTPKTQYLKALAHYFAGECTLFEEALSKARESGYEIPEASFGGCR